MISVFVNGVHRVPYETFVFSGGEVHVKLSQKISFTDITHTAIHARLTSSEEMMRLFMVTDAVKRQYPDCKIHLYTPYLPYARQDRLCDAGEAMSLKVFCNLINMQKYESVTIMDCHSDVGTALLDNVRHIHQANVIEYFPELKNGILNDEYVLVSPDAGAIKKIHHIAKHFHCHNYICGKKDRDTTNGKISYCGIDPSDAPKIMDKNCLIIDDICDGGGTFTALANSLRIHGAKSVDLFVTHGIFSKGIEVLNGFIDKIYTTNSCRDAIDGVITKDIFV